MVCRARRLAAARCSWALRLSLCRLRCASGLALRRLLPKPWLLLLQLLWMQPTMTRLARALVAGLKMMRRLRQQKLLLLLLLLLLLQISSQSQSLLQCDGHLLRALRRARSP